MRLRAFLGDHIVSILLYAAAFGITLFFLSLFRVHTIILSAITLVAVLFGVMILCYEYQRRRRYYRQLFATLDQLDQKYLVHELVRTPSFLDGRLLHQVLYETDKAMNEHIRTYQETMDAFKEYIELWVHEVKLPIAAGQLILHNNPSVVNKKLREQFQRVEDDVEQELYYTRSENSEKDYLIKRCSLDELVQNVIRRNKDALLYGGVAIDFTVSHAMVYTDSKWLEFIINQIMSNAIKYCTKGKGHIRIEVTQDAQRCVLTITDNGIGIPASEVPRVFEKSFTGSNGRSIRSSTGMGLYLCDQLCRKLGHSIALRSREQEGTQVSITFYEEDYYRVLRKEGEEDVHE